jgi:hypothetical protein
MNARPPRYILWSADNVDPRDPFQKRWLLRQTLTRGRAEDIRALDLAEIKNELENLDLPENVLDFWRRYLEALDARGID